MDELNSLVMKELEGRNREPDGLLHCSGLSGCAYSQIQQAMGEVKQDRNDLIDLVVMNTGTMWHKWLQDAFPYLIRHPETDLTLWLPDNWGGSMDGVLLNEPGKYFTLLDLKTMNGEGMRYIKGVKPEHRWQTSAYYYALEKFWIQNKSSFGLSNEIFVYYFPVSRAKDYTAEPVLLKTTPLPRDLVLNEMEQRAKDLTFYKVTGENTADKMPMDIVEKVSKRSGWKNITMKNNWWVNYCPAKDCPCAKRKEVTLGSRSPGGEIAANGDYSVSQICELIKEQNERNPA